MLLVPSVRFGRWSKSAQTALRAIKCRASDIRWRWKDQQTGKEHLELQGGQIQRNCSKASDRAAVAVKFEYAPGATPIDVDEAAGLISRASQRCNVSSTSTRKRTFWRRPNGCLDVAEATL